MSLEIKVNKDGSVFSEEGHAGVAVKFRRNVRYENVEKGEHVLIRTAPYGTEHRTIFPLECVKYIETQEEGPVVHFTEQIKFHGYNEKNKDFYPGFLFSYNNKKLSIPTAYITEVKSKENSLLVWIEAEDDV